MAEDTLAGGGLDKEFQRIAEETRAASRDAARAEMRYSGTPYKSDEFINRSNQINPGKNAAQVAEGVGKSAEGNMGRTVGKIPFSTTAKGVASKALGFIRNPFVASPLGTLLSVIDPSELGGAEEDEKIGRASLDSKYQAIQSSVDAETKASSTATADAVAPPPDPLEMLQLAASATANQDIAKSKIKDINTSVGTKSTPVSYVLQPGQRLVQTFGNTVVKNQKGEIIRTDAQGNIVSGEIPAELRGPAIDEKSVVANKVEGTSKNANFDIVKEFGSLKSMSGDERLDYANQLLVNIGMQQAKEQDKIRAIAAQQAGVNDAQAAYQSFTRLAAQMRPGQRVIEVEESRKSLNEAMIVANKYEADLIAANPQLKQLSEYHAAITRDMSLSIRRDDRRTVAQERQAEKDKDLLVITPDRMVNGRLALDIKQPTNAKDEQATRRAIFDMQKGDKQLQLVLDADKNNITDLLVHPDAKVRQYAFKITRGLERQYLGIKEGAPDPGTVRAIDGIVANPDLWIEKNNGLLPPDMVKLYGQKKQLAKGEKELTGVNQEFRVDAINHIMDKRFRASYDQMQKWTYSDPSIKKVIDTIFKTTPSRPGVPANVSMEDGITAIVNSEMRAPDGRIMTIQDKKDAVLNSLEVTLGNDSKSFLRPSAENYGPEFRDKVNNLLNRAWIRKKGPFSVGAEKQNDNPFSFF